ncbi:MAG: 3-phosphoshikimate 1-carboxyvinyltransferase [Candidatus Marinimicrobia bacterium]|jgi:3-phosphoshikimate 1-carboxyvinyltransferase|nr:3-phosphoshikimate 1-carboxyvinyltransferase [Candidatus Neomarinimicrobiota bacterium]MBT3576918.1 3-phosphoshikimate 1-carboxyvinyltransferase [Candidatus Neomarinimicrobiota bacterium]MBT3681371.1 3-phosphoshikimate 1-carboxyvinyltransferase [Candidatus Neomarinimicrobiota bacterium]MBT3951959.1 3-phosphoshikimate 1-carboxyvinyltransferase [Candidatus Neomarinimicrobiota bacterium]MBT4251840.1 3-phosphoshikimate 1-carboxyvinyltransferase [Candidatus Neomarinimicrobiota bacterium]
MALLGEIRLPGDKSISHRALMFTALSDGLSRLENLNPGADVATTQRALINCGIHIEEKHGVIHVQGGGLRPFKQPDLGLDCGNSGTTARLMMGLLAAHPIHVQFTGDQSLSNRPMDRVFRPLQQMGSNISANKRKYLPLMLSGRDLWALDYQLPYASAQVKSAILLAGLHAKGQTTVKSPAFSRDHTEQMLKAMGARIKVKGREVTVHQLTRPLKPIDFVIPGDFSAAAFFIAAALLVPDSDVILRGVGINPTRTAFLKAVKDMGGKVTVANKAKLSGEAIADIRIRASQLKCIQIYPEQIPNLIDELPLIALLATQAEGETVVTGAEELRVKESDRIAAIVTNLSAWGAKIFEQPDGFHVEGPTPLKGGKVKTFHDHRIAMTLGIAGLISKLPATLDDPDCVDISYPGFFDELRGLIS